MGTHAATLAGIVGLLAFTASASAQIQTNTGGGGGGGASLFGDTGGGSLFGGTGGTQQLGANQTFQLNEEGGSGGFVGRDSTDTGGLLEELAGGANNLANQIQRSFAGRDRGRDANQGADARPPIRVQLKLGFRPSTPLPTQTGATTTMLNSLIEQKGFGSATAAVNDGIVVLEGAVATDADRRMLARLATLEPGVRGVENRLAVTEDLTEPVE